MPRFKLLIEYAGTRYSGWQIQKNARTVQGEIDRAIREVSRRREFELYGSGRTDAGVHALAQVAHLELYTICRPSRCAESSTTSYPPTSTSARSTRRRTGFMRGTMPSRAAISIRSHAAVPRSASRSSGGSANRSTSRRCARPRRVVRRHEGLRGVHRRRSGREVDARARRVGSRSPRPARWS